MNRAFYDDQPESQGWYFWTDEDTKCGPFDTDTEAEEAAEEWWAQ